MVQYTYCLDNPLKYVDPTGLAIDWDEKNLPKDAQDKISKEQDKYNAAKASGNPSAMAAAHKAAEDIRNDYRTGTERGTADGNTIGVPAPKDPLPKAAAEALDKFSDALGKMSDKEIYEYAKSAGITLPPIGSLNASELAELAGDIRQQMVLDMAWLTV